MHLNVHVRSGGATEKCRPATVGNPSATYPTRGRRPGHPRRAHRLRRRARAAKWVAIEGTLRFAMRESGVQPLKADWVAIPENTGADPNTKRAW